MPPPSICRLPLQPSSVCSALVCSLSSFLKHLSPFDTPSLLRPEQILIEKHIGERYTLVFEQLCILLDQTIQGHLDRPGPRVRQRILERCFIPDVVRPEESEALGDLQLIAVMIAGTI